MGSPRSLLRSQRSRPPGRALRGHDIRERRRASRWLWWIVGAFLASQVSITCFAANGPFVDEGLYTVYDKVLAESSWIYIVPLYPEGMIDSPADVIDTSRR